MTYYRRLPKFDYLAPKSVAEVLSLLDQHKTACRLLAGGTITLHQMKERVNVRPFVIGLKGVSGLDRISPDRAQGLTIGSTALLQDVADSTEVRQRCPLLARVCGSLGTPQMRSMGTLGGNVAARFSTSEALPALIALGAEAKLATAAGERVLQVEDLHREMKAGELLTGIRISPPAAGVRTGYCKFAMRERYDYAVVAAAVKLRLEGKKCEEIMIGLGGVSLPTMRAKPAEEIMKGQIVTGAAIDEASRKAAEEGRTGSDMMFSADYKKKVLRVMVERALREAMEGVVP